MERIVLTINDQGNLVDDDGYILWSEFHISQLTCKTLSDVLRDEKLQTDTKGQPKPRYISLEGLRALREAGWTAADIIMFRDQGII